MDREYLIQLMLINTDFSIEEIMEMSYWEIMQHLGYE